MSRTATCSPICSKCNRAIAADDINVAKDVAYCRSCNLAHSLSGLVDLSDLMDGVDFHRPPAGVRYSSGSCGLEVAATHRSLGGAFGSLVFGLVWNGIVSVFVLTAIAGTLHNLHYPIPSWFPAPEMNGSPMSLGATIFLWMFLTPFILIGLTTIAVFLMSIGGRTEVRIDNRNGTIFTGVGPFGYRRRFAVSALNDVRIDNTQWWIGSDFDSRRIKRITIETREGKVIRFGAMLTEERRKFMAASVRKALMG